MRLHLPELAALAICIGCSATTSSSSVRKTTVDSDYDGGVVATAKSTSTDSTSQVVTKEAAIGALDRMVFGDDVVVQPDGGVTSEDGGLPHIKEIVHQAPASTREVAQSNSQHYGTEDEGLDMSYHGSTHVAVDDEDKGKTNVSILKSPLTWIGAAALVSGVLFMLYRLRKSIPFLKFIP